MFQLKRASGWDQKEKVIQSFNDHNSSKIIYNSNQSTSNLSINNTNNLSNLTNGKFTNLEEPIFSSSFISSSRNQYNLEQITNNLNDFSTFSNSFQSCTNQSINITSKNKFIIKLILY